MELEQQKQQRKMLYEQKLAKENEERAVRFGQIFAPTLIYGFFFALCLYNNISGILMPVFSTASIIYCFYVMHLWDIEVKFLSYFCGGVMILLGVSSCLTGNEVIHFFNFIGIFLILIFMLVHNFYDDGKWGFSKCAGAIFITGMETIGAIADPIFDLVAYVSGDRIKKHRNVIYAALGFLIAVPLTVLVAALLMSADAVFNRMAMDLFGDIAFGTVIGVMIVYCIGFMMAYCGMTCLSKRTVNEETTEQRKFSAIIAITALSAISLIYLVFCYIQIAYLFVGGLTLPEGYTYAMYVHEGFYQLLFVCVMNLMIVLAALARFEKNKVLNLLLVVISGCTGIMIASCGFRITMYVKAYGLSFLRLLVYWTLLLIVAFMLGIFWQIFHKEFNLFRYGFVTICILYMSLAFMRPDYVIAKYNLNVLRTEYGSRVDYDYLNELSSDAAPVIADYIAVYENSGPVLFEDYCYHMHYSEGESWRKYNFSKSLARKIIPEADGFGK